MSQLDDLACERGDSARCQHCTRPTHAAHRYCPVLLRRLVLRAEALTEAATKAHAIALDPPPGAPPMSSFVAIVELLEPALEGRPARADS